MEVFGRILDDPEVEDSVGVDEEDLLELCILGLIDHWSVVEADVVENALVVDIDSVDVVDDDVVDVESPHTTVAASLGVTSMKQYSPSSPTFS